MANADAALEKRKADMIAANPALAGTVTFQSNTAYFISNDLRTTSIYGSWSTYKTPHAVLDFHVGTVARKELGLTGNAKYKGNYRKGMPIPKGPNCKGNACDNRRVAHLVPAVDVAIYAIDELGLKEGTIIIREKIVEVEKLVEVPKIVTVEVPKGYVTSLEKREVLSFALTRELRGTEKALRQAYIDNNPDESLRLAARMETIREVMDDLTVDQVEGSPQVVAARSPYKGTGGLFDAV